MNKTNKLSEARKARGEAPEGLEGNYSTFTNSGLIEMLGNGDPQKRTCAVRLLGVRKCGSSVTSLCKLLKSEKALYTKLSVSEALVNIGEPALPELTRLLGRIGRNQHKSLPEKGFYKFSYPLPRDIAARIIIRFGKTALPYIAEVIRTADRLSILEAVDAAGHISFYSKDNSLEPLLLELYRNSCGDLLLKWKCIRAFQSFSSGEVPALLEDIILKGTVDALRWEAIRSIALNGLPVNAEIKNRAFNDACAEVKKTAKKFFL